MKKTRNFLTFTWPLQLHKHPSKAIFITAAQPLSEVVTAVLKLVFNQIEIYNFKRHYFSGVKSLLMQQET